ncbi:19195_t:CDS:2 [Dentiscutata erythropus]|uniref:19195_t:CDS:1 n=1 Tax=Dentiscutata erythropus TaxID=1348616 RepID=A0A9N8VUN1_9GLOM|nr:19195_t:CDS:2 [Dentiscutata erythropus]
MPLRPALSHMDVNGLDNHVFAWKDYQPNINSDIRFKFTSNPVIIIVKIFELSSLYDEESCKLISGSCKPDLLYFDL